MNPATSCQFIVSDKTPLATGESLTTISFISPRTHMPDMGQQVNKERLLEAIDLMNRLSPGKQKDDLEIF